MKTQIQLYWSEHQKNAEINNFFLELVKDGLTKDELKKLIEKRPSLWKRFEGWLEKLP